MKLNIEIAKHERMASSGSSLLRSIQNEDMPVLDLIVREAIQNSLDAAIEETKSVFVDFMVGKFKPVLLNTYFESIGSVLNARYGSAECKYLAIKDSNTVGLTGKLHYSEVVDQDFGNLQKLVYEISKPQTNEGAGGSWGLGKTVYFRAGLGFVIYYSRIKKENGKYESRLAATLVEDENGSDSLIQYPVGTKIKRGIAWWGKRYGGITSKTTCPITDQSTITNLLAILEITPYSGTSTGTTVIIPYIDEKKLLNGIAPSDDVGMGSSGRYYWLNSIEDYIALAIQRWYTPRMSYKYERGPYLKASINGKYVSVDNMAPYYKILLQLYENTTKAQEFAVGSKEIDGIEYFCSRVNTRNILSQTSAGYVSYAKINEFDLHMKAPDNEANPYAFVGKYDIDRGSNAPLLAYIRKPGMVVSYETTGSWLDGVIPTTGSDYIVALFVLNSENEVKGYASKVLEEYVRKGERSDHTAWYDWSFSDKQSYIVSRIKSNTAKILRKTFAQIGDGPTTLTHSGLEKALADLLLPPDGFGRGSNRSGAGRSHGGQGTSHSGKAAVLKVRKTIYRGEFADIEFDLRTGKGQKEIVLELQVATDNTTISAVGWEKPSTIGTAFPLELISISMGNKTGTIAIDSKEGTKAYCGLQISVLNTQKYKIPYGICIVDQNEEGSIVSGVLSFKRETMDILGAISITQKGVETK